MQDVRNQIVKWAQWGIQNRQGFTYEEIRPMPSLANEQGRTPWTGDCSSWVTQCYKWAGAPDPTGNGYNGWGNTLSLLDHGKLIAETDLKPGDVIVFGPRWDASHQHTVISLGGDLVSSMGHPGDPEQATIAAVAESVPGGVYFLRFDTIAPGNVFRPRSPAWEVNAERPDAFPDMQPPTISKWHPMTSNAAVTALRLCFNLCPPNEVPHFNNPHLGGCGVRTTNAIIDYQRHNNLTPDGQCGIITWNSLGWLS